MFPCEKNPFFFVDILWNSIEINYAISNGEFLNFKELTADCQFKKKKKKIIMHNWQLTHKIISATAAIRIHLITFFAIRYWNEWSGEDLSQKVAKSKSILQYLGSRDWSRCVFVPYQVDLNF